MCPKPWYRVLDIRKLCWPNASHHAAKARLPMEVYVTEPEKIGWELDVEMGLGRICPTESMERVQKHLTKEFIKNSVSHFMPNLLSNQSSILNTVDCSRTTRHRFICKQTLRLRGFPSFNLDIDFRLSDKPRVLNMPFLFRIHETHLDTFISVTSRKSSTRYLHHKSKTAWQ